MPLDATERQCKACGAVSPPGGLRLGPEGGGADYEWFCTKEMDCLARVQTRMREVVQIRADEVELGDHIHHEGDTYTVDGWHVDGNGRFIIEFGNRNHVFHSGDRITVERRS